MYIKCSNVTRTKCPIAMYKISKSDFFENFGPLIEHSPHWINFIILTFISENNRYFRCPYKVWSKFISFHMKKKRKFKIGQYRFYEEKGEFGGPRNESLCFKQGTPTILGPNSLEKKKTTLKLKVHNA